MAVCRHHGYDHSMVGDKCQPSVTKAVTPKAKAVTPVTRPVTTVTAQATGELHLCPHCGQAMPSQSPDAIRQRRSRANRRQAAQP